MVTRMFLAEILKRVALVAPASLVSEVTVAAGVCSIPENWNKECDVVEIGDLRCTKDLLVLCLDNKPVGRLYPSGEVIVAVHGNIYCAEAGKRSCIPSLCSITR